MLVPLGGVCWSLSPTSSRLMNEEQDGTKEGNPKPRERHTGDKSNRELDYMRPLTINI